MRNTAIVVAILTLLATSVFAQDSAPAQLRVAHFSPGTGDVDVYLNGELALENFAFPTITDWMQVQPGTYSVAITAPDAPIEEAVIGPIDVDLGPGSWHTAAAIGVVQDDTHTVQVIEENFAPIAPTEARVTVFHAIPNAPLISLFADDNLLIGGLAYPGAADGNDGTATVDIVNNTYNLSVAATEDPDTVFFEFPNTELAAGQHYFIAAVGLFSAADTVFTITNPAEVGMAEDTADAGAEDNMAHLRIGHFALDAPAVDVYVNGDASTFTGLEYPGLSQWVDVSPGTYTVAVAPSGAPIEEAVIGPLEVNLNAGEWYTVSAIGLIENETLESQIIVEDYSPLARLEARVTVFHAVESEPAIAVFIGDEYFERGIAYPGGDGDGDGAVAITVIDGIYDIRVTANENEEDVIFELPATELEAGNHYFIAAINDPQNIEFFFESIGQAELTAE